MKVLLLSSRDHYYDDVVEKAEEEGIEIRVKCTEDLIDEDLEETRCDAVIVSMKSRGSEKKYLETIRKIHQRRNRLPIIAIDHFDNNDKIERCLEAGCSDYIKPPISNREILLKVTFWIQWELQGGERFLSLTEDYTYDLSRNELLHRKDPVLLNRREKLFLHLLARNPGSYVPVETLIDYIWGYDGDENRLRVLVYKLRKKIGKELILSMRGVGYKIVSILGQELSPAALAGT